MYKTKTNTKYYLYDFAREGYVLERNSLEEMLEAIARSYNRYDYFNNHYCYGNAVLDDYNCTGNDTVNYFGIEPNFHLRRYMVFDSNFRIIDVRNYSEIILNYKIKNRYYLIPSKKAKYREKNKPVFRKGPVPYTGNKRFRYSSIRLPHTMNEKRYNASKNKNEIRAKRRSLPSSWDDIPRTNSRSWKDQSKKRKQWM